MTVEQSLWHLSPLRWPWNSWPWNINSGPGLKWSLLECSFSKGEQHLKSGISWGIRWELIFFHKEGEILLNVYKLSQLKMSKLHHIQWKKTKCGQALINPYWIICYLGLSITWLSFQSKHFGHWNFHIYIKVKPRKNNCIMTQFSTLSNIYFQKLQALYFLNTYHYSIQATPKIQLFSLYLIDAHYCRRTEAAKQRVAGSAQRPSQIQLKVKSKACV